MAAEYPSAIKSFTQKSDGVDTILAAHMNAVQDEVNAIETELGTTPKGSFNSVKERLDQMVPHGWIKFNGTGTVAINDSENVTSLTDNGTGDYTVTWDADFGSADYAASVSSNDHTEFVFAQVVGSLRIKIADQVDGAQDASLICAIAVGDH